MQDITLNAVDNTVFSVVTIKCKCGEFIDIRPNEGKPRTCNNCGNKIMPVFYEIDGSLLLLCVEVK
jgi:hypothetical protein